MNIESMTIGKRIALGFAVILAILLIIGVFAIYQMNGASTAAGYLSDEYIPELGMISKLQGSVADARVGARSFQFTGDKEHLDRVQKALVEVKATIKELETLSEKSVKLALLKKEIPKALAIISSYETLLQETVKVSEAQVAARNKAVEEGLKATKTIDDLLKTQDAKMVKEIADGAAASALAERHEKIKKLNELVDLLNSARIANLLSQSRRDVSFIQAALSKFQAYKAIVTKMLPTFRSAEDIKEINEVATDFEDYEKAVALIISATKTNDEVGEKRAKVAEELSDFADDLAKAGQEGADKVATETTSSLSSASFIMLCSAIFAVAFGIFCAFWIARSIIKVLSLTTSSLSEGSDQVASASMQISSASQSLAEGASEQAASLEETSASLEEIASMTKRNAENAVNAKELANETRSAAEEGSSNMEEMNHAMTDIQSSSDNIAKIIKTIDEIAFQTNILALNAAVEAARAGEAGMGFAVVADEVRNLAQRSAQAAKETAEKIEDSIRKSANGVQISSKVTSSLTLIVTKARQVDELVAEIATASREQSQGLDQVNTAVTQMDKITQTNAASAEESASASEELNAQAATLRDLVSELQTLVGGTSSGSSSRPAPRYEHREPVSARAYSPAPKKQESHKASLGSSQRPALSHSRPALGSSKKRNPSEEIPLEDGFKDF